MKYYTTKELSEMLKLSPATLRRLASQGELPKPLVLGSTRRWEKDAIDSFLSKKQSA